MSSETCSSSSSSSPERLPATKVPNLQHHHVAAAAAAADEASFDLSQLLKEEGMLGGKPNKVPLGTSLVTTTT